MNNRNQRTGLLLWKINERQQGEKTIESEWSDMPAFLSNLTKFYGTGEKNEAGQNLEEFLELYDPRKYETPSNTTDAVIFAYEGEKCDSIDGLKVLLVKRSNHPSIGYWALPGGFANMRENLDETARRELEEETGVKGLVMEQLATYGDYDRDPRTRVITTAYMAVVPENAVKVQAGDDAADAVWCEVSLEGIVEDRDYFSENCEENNQALEKIHHYRLHIKNESRGLDTEAKVVQTIRGNLVREEHFQVEKTGEIAVDHSAIIVQALLTLKKRL